MCGKKKKNKKNKKQKIVHVRYIKILTSPRGVLVIFLYLVWFLPVRDIRSCEKFAILNLNIERGLVAQESKIPELGKLLIEIRREFQV